jgi:predicted ribosome quality control (RQC) complex YloA/Tae2 family protein
MKILGESDDLLEEELVVDMDEVKDGTFRSDKETLEYYEEMRKAKESAEEKEEENKDLKKENEKLQETIKKFKHKNKQYKDVVEKLSQKLNETLLSNAKLVYSNKTLGDASLNERQKSKIVEAIAKAKTPEEAKNLHEALNATVTSGQENKSPRTLSESVQRKSTLSGILPRRKQVNESEEHTFAEHMKKLAGIK